LGDWAATGPALVLVAGKEALNTEEGGEAGELLANTLMLVKVLLLLALVVMPRDMFAETSARLVGAFRMTAEMDGNLNRRGSALAYGRIDIARHVIDTHFEPSFV